MRNLIFHLLLFAFLAISCKLQQTTIFIKYTQPEIAYSGRIDSSGGYGVDLYWSGSSIRINFEGESVEALLQDETGDNYYNVIIDNTEPLLLRPDTSERYYLLASQLTSGTHSLEIFKRTEWNRGKTRFEGFRIEGKAKILAKPHDRERKIEFYGNSITAGYAVEDTTGLDRPDSTFTNHYLSYAAMVARHYNAESQCICKSGIGITISWFPLIMPDIYDRLVPDDSNSLWDFSLYRPDLVVINLFQNDSWLVNMPERPEFKKNFGDTAPSDHELILAYEKFIAELRLHYPETPIICALGNMDATKKGSKWMEYIERAAANLHDAKIYTHFFPYKETPGHPSVEEQELMAQSLIEFIDSTILW
ncbi:MAG: hypothetical protein KDC80_09180 [Saprospiraceae bacterium]|nr:hypothetical protein [Saprospiraceae bacterium]